MSSVTKTASAHERACSSVAANFEARWLRSYVGSKLRSDPAFRAAYDFLRESDHPILDLGCGVGLLAFYLRERGLVQPITGIDRDARKIERAKAVARRAYRHLEFRDRNIRDAFDFAGNVALFDVLHYLAPSDQERLLERAAECVAPGGVLIIRDCPRDARPRFWLTLLAEKFAQLISWNLPVPLHFPTRDSIASSFPESRFTSTSMPLWGRTPFNNHLFVFERKPLSTTAPAAV